MYDSNKKQRKLTWETELDILSCHLCIIFPHLQQKVEVISRVMRSKPSLFWFSICRASRTKPGKICPECDTTSHGSIHPFSSSFVLGFLAQYPESQGHALHQSDEFFVNANLPVGRLAFAKALTQCSITLNSFSPILISELVCTGDFYAVLYTR